MTSVVVDTNVLVSALLNERGAEAAVLALIVAGKLIWCVSEATVAEYDSVLNRSKFQHLERWKITAALALAKAGEMAIVTTIVTRSPHDPDNRFLECAEAAAADFLVTGNTRHFPKSWKATKIVNARQFLDSLASL
jgi:putative PIN family toxin of toxin-antitoxin system